MASNFVATLKRKVLEGVLPVKRRVRRMLMSRAERRFELVGPPELWEMKRRFQIDFLRKFGLAPRHFVVDIGCGVLRGNLSPVGSVDDPHHGFVIPVLMESPKEVIDRGRHAIIYGDHVQRCDGR